MGRPEGEEKIGVPTEAVQPQSENRKSFLRKAFTLGAFVIADAAAGGGITRAAVAAEKAFGTPEFEPDIQARVDAEVARAASALESGELKEILEARYCVATLYYSNNFLKKVLQERDPNPSRRIVIDTARRITPQARAKYVEGLKQQAYRTLNKESPARLISKRPLPRIDFGIGENAHTDAVDLFAEPGTEVRSVTRGIVVLAEQGWNAKDAFSTTSPKGGNTVIVFNPDTEEFHRYCHLGSVAVRVGETFEAGRKVGEVGNTGSNASLPGHGKHLHYETNQYRPALQAMRPLTDTDLRQRVESAMA